MNWFHLSLSFFCFFTFYSFLMKNNPSQQSFFRNNSGRSKNTWNVFSASIFVSAKTKQKIESHCFPFMPSTKKTASSSNSTTNIRSQTSSRTTTRSRCVRSLSISPWAIPSPDSSRRSLRTSSRAPRSCKRWRRDASAVRRNLWEEEEIQMNWGGKEGRRRNNEEKRRDE